MKMCKVKPIKSTCSACIETQQMFGVVDDCARCEENDKEYELISVGVGLFGSCAIVQINGVMEKVPLSRIYDIKEKKND